jgi:hypothetical protein
MQRIPDYGNSLMYAEFDPVHARWLDDPAPMKNMGIVNPILINNVL